MQNIVLEAGLDLSELDCIIFGCGPGSYTGSELRPVKLGLSYGLDIPVVSVSSLEAIAYSFVEENFLSVKEGDRILASILARPDEYFVGGYEWKNDFVEPIFKEKLVGAEDLFPLPKGVWFGIGDTSKFRDSIKSITGVEPKAYIVRQHYSASSIFKIGQNKIEAGKFLEPASAIPKYLKEVIVG